MKMLLTMGLSLFLGHNSLAQTLRYEKSVLFIKVTRGAIPPTNSLITAQKHLFGDLYQLATTDALALEDQLRTHPQVIFAEKSFYSESSTLPVAVENKLTPRYLSKSFNDPQVSQIWSFQDASDNGVSVEEAYRALPNRAPQEIIVAVVDTGVDYNHEDLKENMWINDQEIPANGIDDDQNGYVDDIHGINPLKRNAQGVASGDPMASSDHGTHVAGTIAAVQNNGVGIAGIASHAKIMAIRTVPDAADETDRDVVESFLYAAKHGARLINCSFGKKVNEGGQVVSETIKHIGETYGVLVLAAAGNDSMGPLIWFNLDKKPRYPAAFSNDHLLVVASTKESGGLSGFSNVGKTSVDVAAPGSNIYSTLPRNRYGSMSGTSMATPTTVGVAAQILSYYPYLKPLELKALVMESVTPVSSFKSRMVSGGRIDLRKALETLR